MMRNRSTTSFVILLSLMLLSTGGMTMADVDKPSDGTGNLSKMRREELVKVLTGTVPEEWCLRRRAQIGNGRVYGIAAYVMKMTFALGRCFKAKGVGSHGIVGLPVEAGTSVLGWKIAAADAA